MKRLRGAIYGCGMISEFHLRGWARIPEVEIVALGDRAIERAQQRRAEFAPEARIYTRLEDLLETEDLDFVDILTVPSVHRQHCSAARASGVHIICQKPMADTLEDAAEMAEEFQGYSKLFAVHENHRYRPWFQAIARHAAAGAFGPLCFVKLEHLNATAPGEAYKNESPRGVLLEYGSHLVDMMRCLLGEPHRVYARLHHLNTRVRGESLAHLAYEYPSCTAVIEVAWKHSAMMQGTALIAGQQGEAFYEGTLTRGEDSRLRLSRGLELTLDQRRSPYQDYVDSFYLLQRECADVMLGRRASVIQTAGEHLRTLRCTFAAYDAAESGRTLSIAS